MQSHVSRPVLTLYKGLSLTLLILILLASTTHSQARERSDTGASVTDREHMDEDRRDMPGESESDGDNEEDPDTDPEEPSCKTNCPTTPAGQPPSPNYQSNESGLQITLRELGFMQIAAHDLFNVNRDTNIDTENGDLDLTTVFDHGEENIAIGGEGRNQENIFIASVGAEIGSHYYHYLDIGKSEAEAKRLTIKFYHRELQKVYQKIFGENFPRPVAGEVTMTENLALRSIHDFLPGTITFESKEIETVDFALIGKTLSTRELKQLTSPLDGLFDEEFLDVVIFIPPSMILHINLLERDQTFGEQFNAEFTFDHLMSELADGSYDDGEDVTRLMKQVFAKGLHFDL